MPDAWQASQGAGSFSSIRLSLEELNSLNEGQTVEYEIVQNRGKPSAENLKVSR